MSLSEVVVEGTLKADGTLELDEKPNLSPGRVKVVLPRIGIDDDARRLVAVHAECIAGLGYNKMTGNVWRALQRLTELKLIQLTIPGKPNSKNQKRRITSKGFITLGGTS